MWKPVVERTFILVFPYDATSHLHCAVSQQDVLSLLHMWASDFRLRVQNKRPLLQGPLGSDQLKQHQGCEFRPRRTWSCFLFSLDDTWSCDRKSGTAHSRGCDVRGDSQHGVLTYETRVEAWSRVVVNIFCSETPSHTLAQVTAKPRVSLSFVSSATSDHNNNIDYLYIVSMSQEVTITVKTNISISWIISNKRTSRPTNKTKSNKIIKKIK